MENLIQSTKITKITKPTKSKKVILEKDSAEVRIGPFMSLLTDFGFKRVFGREQSKPFLMRFLNLLVFSKTDEKIETIEFLNTENLGHYVEDRKVVFDLKCQTSKGETIIIEMQKARQKYFKARSVFYGCSSLVSQAVKGIWDFNLKKVYVVSLLNFELEGSEEMITNFELEPKNNKAVTLDYLALTFVELPKLKKTLQECSNELEQWIYIILHLGELRDAPEPLKELENWHRFFELANIPKKASIEYKRYFRELQNEKEFDSVVLAKVEEMMGDLEVEKKEAEKREKKAQQEAKSAQQREQEAHQQAKSAQQEAKSAQQQVKSAQQEAKAAQQREHASKIEMAKMMLEFGKSIGDIMTKTGLTEAEILSLQKS